MTGYHLARLVVGNLSNLVKFALEEAASIFLNILFLSDRAPAIIGFEGCVLLNEIFLKQGMYT
jgi:hypothetical protein